MNHKKIIEDQRKIYSDNFLKHKDSSLGTFQNNRATQHLRFEKIIDPFRNILNKNTSFHDFGCGSCDMYDYMQQHSIECNYSGTEIMQEMIDHAKTKFPGISVSNRDLLKESLTDKYDIVVFSGGLYFPGNIPQDEWAEYVFEIIGKMYEMCKIGISFNLLTTYSTFRDPNLFYLDPREIMDFCINNLSRFVSLQHNYPLYEWTMAVFKPDYIKTLYHKKEFEKYFK